MPGSHTNLFLPGSRMLNLRRPLLGNVARYMRHLPDFVYNNCLAGAPVPTTLEVGIVGTCDQIL